MRVDCSCSRVQRIQEPTITIDMYSASLGAFMQAFTKCILGAQALQHQQACSSRLQDTAVDVHVCYRLPIVTRQLTLI
jgi:hypothetical protein